MNTTNRSIAVCLIVLQFNGMTSLTVNLTITTSTKTTVGILGSDMDLTCSFKKAPGENPFQLNIFPAERGRNQKYLVHNIGHVLVQAVTRDRLWDFSRMSALPVNVSSTQVDFRVTDLRCSDSHTYVCEVEYSNVRRQHSREIKSMKLQVAVSKPKLVIVKGVSLFSDVIAGEQIVFNCSALVGSSGTSGSSGSNGSNGSSRTSGSWALTWWIIWGGGRAAEHIGKDDDRVTEHSAVIGPGCINGTVSQLTLTTLRSYHKVAVACFNGHFSEWPAPAKPQLCEDYNLCQDSGTVKILYPVSSDVMRVTISPEKPLQGDTATLTCWVEAAHPEPEVSWTRDGRALESEKAGWGKRTLTLYNLDDDTCPGNYTCAAYNTVRGVKHTATTTERLDVGKGSGFRRVYGHLKELSRVYGVNVYAMIAVLLVCVLAVSMLLVKCCSLICCGCGGEEKMKGRREKRRRKKNDGSDLTFAEAQQVEEGGKVKVGEVEVGEVEEGKVKE